MLGRDAPINGYAYSIDCVKSVLTGRTIKEVAGAGVANWIPREDEQSVGDAGGGHDVGTEEALQEIAGA